MGKEFLRWGKIAVMLGAVLFAIRIWPNVEVVSLRKKAQTACLCERALGPGGKAECWPAFERAIAPKHARAQVGNAVFCGLVTEAHRDWKDGDRWRRVVTHYLAYGPAGRTAVLCTRAEAAQVESAIGRDLEGSGRVSAATLQLAEDISRGRPVRDVPDGSSCL